MHTSATISLPLSEAAAALPPGHLCTLTPVTRGETEPRGEEEDTGKERRRRRREL